VSLSLSIQGTSSGNTGQTITLFPATTILNTIDSATVSGFETGDAVRATVTGTNITGSFASGTLTFSGQDSAANYQTVFDSITAESGTAGVRNLTVELVAGSNSATVTSTLTISVPTVDFFNGAVPANPNVFQGSGSQVDPVTVGMIFSSSVAGTVNSIMFYKGTGNTGPHTVGLWDANGNELASATSASEPATGWVTVPLATPVSIAANTNHTVGYLSSASYTADDENYFTAAKTVGDLTVPANGGVYVYGSTLAFPTGSYNATNYYVDVAFAPSQQQGGGSPSPSPWVPAGYIYQAIASDEFTEANLDNTKWETRYAGSGGTQQSIGSNGEQEMFEEGQHAGPNHVMTGSSVKLTAYPPNSTTNGLYPSGMLRLVQTFNFGSQTTGFYIECKAKIPGSYGSWPAFWFAAEPEANGDAPWPPEMDVAEFMINNPSLGASNTTWIHMSIKFNNAGPNSGGGTGPWDGWMAPPSSSPSGWSWTNTGDTHWVTNEDLSQAFHVYALQMVPGGSGDPINGNTGQPTHKFTYFVDGVLVGSGYYDAGIGADGSSPVYNELLIDHAVGGIGGLSPTASMFPSAFEIMYVRTYISQQDSAALKPSTITPKLMPPTGG
jgi:hypothetical protein